MLDWLANNWDSLMSILNAVGLLVVARRSSSYKG